MAKARPKINGLPANSAGDPPPGLGNPRPGQRDPIYQKIGQEIVKAWKTAAATGTELDRTALEAAIAQHLRLASKAADPTGDPMGEVEVGVIVDPKPQGIHKFVWIVVPYPEAPTGVPLNAWLNMYDGSPQLQQQLGEAVLFGCGR